MKPAGFSRDREQPRTVWPTETTDGGTRIVRIGLVLFVPKYCCIVSSGTQQKDHPKPRSDYFCAGAVVQSQAAIGQL